jgi:hypothetical protein
LRGMGLRGCGGALARSQLEEPSGESLDVSEVAMLRTGSNDKDMGKLRHIRAIYTLLVMAVARGPARLWGRRPGCCSRLPTVGDQCVIRGDEGHSKLSHSPISYLLHPANRGRPSSLGRGPRQGAPLALLDGRADLTGGRSRTMAVRSPYVNLQPGSASHRRDGLILRQVDPESLRRANEARRAGRLAVAEAEAVLWAPFHSMRLQSVCEGSVAAIFDLTEDSRA